MEALIRRDAFRTLNVRGTLAERMIDPAHEPSAGSGAVIATAVDDLGVTPSGRILRPRRAAICFVKQLRTTESPKWSATLYSFLSRRACSPARGVHSRTPVVNYEIDGRSRLNSTMYCLQPGTAESVNFPDVWKMCRRRLRTEETRRKVDFVQERRRSLGVYCTLARSPSNNLRGF